MKALLEIKNLSLVHEEKTILKNINFSVNKGEIIALIGNNGVGKTMLSRAILGLLPNNINVKGDIFYDNSLLNKALQESLRGNEISYIPQFISYLDPLMKVGIASCAKYSKNRNIYKKVLEAFEFFGLHEEVLNMYPNELSGGMARKILIITALISSPNLVIADEPTSSLDAQSILKLLEVFRKLKSENKAVIFITHDILLATKIADKIIILNNGIVEEITHAKSFIDGIGLKSEYAKAIFDTFTFNNFSNSKYLHIKMKDEIANS